MFANFKRYGIVCPVASCSYCGPWPSRTDRGRIALLPSLGLFLRFSCGIFRMLRLVVLAFIVVLARQHLPHFFSLTRMYCGYSYIINVN
jgi:hypothetical protein